jgi:hypothetical protein
VLFGGRKRQEAMQKREAAGESLWSAQFPENVRVRIWRAFTRAPQSDDQLWTICETAGSALMDYLGTMSLAGQSNVINDLGTWFLRVEDGEVPSGVEAFLIGMHAASAHTGYGSYIGAPDISAFVDELNQVLREERISYSCVEGRMIEFASMELHEGVVAPVVRLLHGKGLETVEAAYRGALDQIAKGHPDNAITDAGVALQQMLAKLGADGDKLGTLIKSARSKGLLAPHDARLEKGISELMEWVSADRSTLGDAHHPNRASTEDAWLAVHVVGALILRLSGGPGRGSAA